MLTDALAVVGLALTGVTIYLGVRQLLPPKRELDVLVQPAAGDPDRTTGAAVTITSSGHFDVGPENFSNAQPLSIELSSQVTSIDGTLHVPERGSRPKLTVGEGGRLQLDPCLLRAGEKIITTVKTTSPVSKSVRLQHSMINCKVVASRRRGLSVTRFIAVVAGVIVGLAMAMFALAWQAQIIGQHFSVSPDPISLSGDFKMCAKGLEPFAIVTIKLDSYAIEPPNWSYDELASGQVEATGSVCVQARLPEGSRPGIGSLTVVIVAGGGSQYTYIPVHVVP